jgi:hypothetical protein
VAVFTHSACLTLPDTLPGNSSKCFVMAGTLVAGALKWMLVSVMVGVMDAATWIGISRSASGAVVTVSDEPGGLLSRLRLPAEGGYRGEVLATEDWDEPVGLVRRRVGLSRSAGWTTADFDLAGCRRGFGPSGISGIAAPSAAKALDPKRAT